VATGCADLDPADDPVLDQRNIIKIFITGATSYIGSAIVEKLLVAGHKIVTLARSDKSARTLETQGIEPLRGNLSKTHVRISAAQSSDGMIHNAFGGMAYARRSHRHRSDG
jgi:uncharacterized protein YbjT (DUF2867 family)